VIAFIVADILDFAM